MSDQRKGGIAWTETTWNPIRGCSRVSPGCQHCYAEARAVRMAGPGQPYHGLVDHNGRWTGVVRILMGNTLTLPLHWRRPRRVFVNSMSDLFHESIPDEAIDRIFAVMMLARQHVFQVLTKRADRMHHYLRTVQDDDKDLQRFRNASVELGDEPLDSHDFEEWPPSNIWLGASCEDQQRADERLPLLLDTPAAVRWVSAEPLLGPIQFPPSWFPERHCAMCARRGLDWVVVGGESGPGHRTLELAWLRKIVHACRAARVPVFVKQDSGPRPGRQGRIPDHLWIREYPR